MAERDANGRPALDERRILAAAVEFIDTHGLRELTMRRLGAHLGVEGMALYRHVPGRDALLDGVVESVVDELFSDPEVRIDPTDGWHDYLQRIAVGMRRIALAHPEIFPLVATRPPAAPWVRPPLRSLRFIETFLVALRSCGFSDDAAVATYRAFSSFLLGYLLLEVANRGVAIGPVDNGESPVDDLSRYPTVRRLEEQLSRDLGDAGFEEALEALIDRIALLLPPKRRRS
jgi:AcrR family transcriptional regulator